MDLSGARSRRWKSEVLSIVDAVLRILRGEDLDALSRELGVTTTKLAQYKNQVAR